ncbi:ABC transporter ATP-binding protein [Oleiharenicola lentus]|uniref:ABC transporter ATP-binding protein n=1 Tax=Oleiharenicola lentus TaxID=2508720 RepID=UPI003F6615D3
MSQVILRQLSKIYPAASKSPEFHAVRGIDLEIQSGEFMVLVGPSGCGKSTTLRMIAGLEEISSGTIAIDDRTVNDVLPKDRDIAMVFQNYALYPHMSVYENMAFGLKLRKMPKPEIDQRVREAAVLLGLEDHLERKPKALSGGQRQRVAVGRAIVRKPKVFLFDEPLSNLDAKMRVSMRTEISKLHARLGATMIYVTHDQVEAMTMGDRICVMKDGHILQVDTPLNLYNQPASLFVAGFIGSPPMNFLRGTIQRTGETLTFVETNSQSTPAKLVLKAPHAAHLSSELGRELIMGIRPENIRPASATSRGAASITATVELCEPMGAETMVYLTTGATAFIGRFAPTTHYAALEKISVEFDAAAVHFFDPETERRLPMG